MKTVYSTSDYPDALIKKGMLEQAGFLVYVENLNSVGGAMPHLGYSAGHRIMVSDSDEDNALELLSETVSGSGAHTVSAVASSNSSDATFSIKYALIFAAVVMVVYFSFIDNGMQLFFR